MNDELTMDEQGTTNNEQATRNEEETMSISVKTNFDQVYKELGQMQKAPEKVIKRTIADFKRRAPSWIAQEVVKKYNIKKSEITPAKGGSARGQAGSISTQGETLDSAALVYKGRVLTPIHFGMTPKAPKQSYALKAQVIKGDKKTWGKVKKQTKKQRANIGRNFTHQSTRSSGRSPIMLMSTGGTNYIPFQRQSQNRKDLKAIKTLSMPQMVTNEKVEKNIADAINEKLGSRFDHYVEQYFK